MYTRGTDKWTCFSVAQLLCKGDRHWYANEEGADPADSCYVHAWIMHKGKRLPYKDIIVIPSLIPLRQLSAEMGYPCNFGTHPNQLFSQHIDMIEPRWLHRIFQTLGKNEIWKVTLVSLYRPRSDASAFRNITIGRLFLSFYRIILSVCHRPEDHDLNLNTPLKSASRKLNVESKTVINEEAPGREPANIFKGFRSQWQHWEGIS